MGIVVHKVKGSKDTTWKQGLDVSVDPVNTMQLNISEGSIWIAGSETKVSALNIPFESHPDYDKLVRILVLTDGSVKTYEVLDDGVQSIPHVPNVAFILAMFKISKAQTNLNLEDIHIIQTVK